MSTTGETAMPGPGEETAIEAYTRTYQEHHSRLVAYARTLTGDAWLAEDLTAEAHFRVWRRISAGHQVDHIPGYLAATIRNLAVDLGHAPKELPQGDQLERLHPAEPATTPVPQEGAYAVMLAGALKQLPHRWVRALWLTEVEDWSLEAVGDDLGTNRNATAVLLHRAREGLRQAFLRAQPGAPDEASCAEHWERIPAHVRGTSSARQDRALRAHAEGCADCRARIALLERANHRLPALVGPALLLAFAGGGAARYLIPTAGARAAARAHGAGHGAVRVSGHAAAKSGPASGSVGAGTLAVAGGLVLAAAGAVAAFTLTGSHSSPQPAALAATQQSTTAPASPTPASTPASPSASTSTTPATTTAPKQAAVTSPIPNTAAGSPSAAATTQTPEATTTTPAAQPSPSSTPPLATPTSTPPSPTTASPTPSTPSTAPTSPSDSPSPTVATPTPTPSTTAASPSTPATPPTSTPPTTDPTCWTLSGLSLCWNR
ncbi:MULTISPECIES: sigma-70 family RNA polymerase sigma factor [Streptacidiphilus]|uniref:Sigma factor n=1 Tax=Streptacidiphilus cavernicola TaxID=3342716 RepID=A0ABV6UT80_9ACTN|nr:sigma-70 family RNA polymerase sigma factor [Streptacidiphilus jeojiense]